MRRRFEILTNFVLGQYWVCWSDGCYGVVFECKDGEWSTNIADAKKYWYNPVKI